MAIWKTLIIGGRQIKSFKTGTIEWLPLILSETIIYEKSSGINLTWAQAEPKFTIGSKIYITKLSDNSVEEFVIETITPTVKSLGMKSSLGTLTILNNSNGVWESGSFVTSNIKSIVVDTTAPVIKFSGISTTPAADIVTWFNANGQAISTTVNENTFTANFKLVANLADGTTKTWNRIGAYFNSDPFTFYPNGTFDNHHELFSKPATVWGSSNKWNIFPAAATGNPNDAGRTGILVNTFEIIKIT